MLTEEPTAIGSQVEDAIGIRYTRFSDSESHNDGDWINQDGLIKQWSETHAVRVVSVNGPAEKGATVGLNAVEGGAIVHRQRCSYDQYENRPCDCGAVRAVEAILTARLAATRAAVWDEGHAKALGYDLSYHLDREEWSETGEPKENPYRLARGDGA